MRWRLGPKDSRDGGGHAKPLHRHLPNLRQFQRKRCTAAYCTAHYHMIDACRHSVPCGLPVPHLTLGEDSATRRPGGQAPCLSSWLLTTTKISTQA
jgi:hypothetical protein